MKLQTCQVNRPIAFECGYAASAPSPLSLEAKYRGGNGTVRQKDSASLCQLQLHWQPSMTLALGPNRIL